MEERLRGGVLVVHTGSRELLKIDPSTSLVVWGGDFVRLRGGVFQEVLAGNIKAAALAVRVLRIGFICLVAISVRSCLSDLERHRGTKVGTKASIAVTLDRLKDAPVAGLLGRSTHG